MQDKIFISTRHIFSTRRQGHVDIMTLETTPALCTSRRGVSVTMGDCAKLWARHWAAGWFSAALLGIAAVFSCPLKANAQDTAIISRGDAAVTAFSGARQLGEVPSGLHPLDVTFIDVNGSVLQVFDLTSLGGAPSGQVANAPIKFQATSGEIGQVFGVALDGDTANGPNAFEYAFVTVNVNVPPPVFVIMVSLLHTRLTLPVAQLKSTLSAPPVPVSLSVQVPANGIGKVSDPPVAEKTRSPLKFPAPVHSK